MLLSTTKAQFFALTNFITAGSVGAALGVYGLTNPVLVSAAVAGAVSSVLFNVLSDQPQKPQKMLRHLVRQISAFLIGAFFGLFMGASVASVTPLDRAAATYFGGLMGYGLVAGLQTQAARKALSDWVLQLFRGSSSAGSKPNNDKELED